LGVADVDLHGGDITFDADGRLLLWTNIGPAAGLYELDPTTAAASAFDLRPYVTLAGLAGPGHANVMHGASPPNDRLYEMSSVTGLTGIQAPLTLDGLRFDHKRGDLDSPYCANDPACADANECTANFCSPGGCRSQPADRGQELCGVGACQRAMDRCLDGELQTCIPGLPAADDASCNGVDDDCDGLVDEDVSAPTSPPFISFTLADGIPIITWSPVVGASGYDVVSGDATELHASRGEFTSATSACLADELSITSVVAAETIAPDEIIWYLVRPTGCGAQGSYNVDGTAQASNRDLSIAGAAAACP
jgi:hypothetical protein